MPATDLPCVPESRLPAELAAQLPTSTPPAPWPCRVRAVLWLQRATSPLPAGSPFAGRTRNLAIGGFIDYLESPVGPYREVLAGQLLRGLGLPVVHIPFIAVDSLPSVHGGRTHWDLPKAYAEFSGDIGAGQIRADGEAWSVSASAVPYGLRFPVIGPLHNDQGRGRATSSLRGTARLARIEVSANGESLTGWLGHGTHLGLVAEGRMVVGPPR